MKILITGAAGFLGRNLLKYIATVHPEHEIIAADLNESLRESHAGSDSEISRFSFCYLDVTDADACRNLMRTAKPTHVVHAAAVTLNEDPEARQQTSSVNLEGALNILKASLSAGSMQRILLLSSSGLYKQSSDAEPCDEEHPLDLSTEYARTKRQVEMQMAKYEAIGGVPILAARVGPVYGEYERSSATRPRISIIQKLVDALSNKRTICVTGTEMHRDWTHAEDIATALERLLFASTLNHRIYNVSCGVSVSSSNILSLFVERGVHVRRVATSKMAEMVLSPEQSRKALVIERLKQDTGFTPQFDIATGIDQLIAASSKYAK